MRYELTIDATYLDEGRWDAAAGIREFMQNARDAAIEQGAQLEVTHRVNSEGKGVLVIANEGAVLAKDTLLLGRSSKRDRQDELAGKWGEGYKLGSLALIRAGYDVKIRNGGEVWIPAVEASERFDGRPVLVFHVNSGRAERNRVQVEITGVDQEAWKALRENYLFLNKREIKQIETDGGTLLLDDKFKGRVYVKDILVMYDEAIKYGYNLRDAQLDRDRRIIESYDLEARMQRIWTAAAAKSPEFFEDFYQLLQEGARDVRGIGQYTTVPADVQTKIVERFQTDYGDKAVPVKSLADSKDIEHLGARGIVTPAPLAATLSKVLGDINTVKERLKNEVKERFSWSHLSQDERENLDRAVTLVNTQAPLTLDDIDVVSFRSADLGGLFKDGKVLVARRLLVSRKETLKVVVHETAHRKGIDGDKAHVAEIERIWAGIADQLHESVQSTQALPAAKDAAPAIAIKGTPDELRLAAVTPAFGHYLRRR